MLFGQQRGGAQHRHLLAVGDGDEGGAQSNFSLAEADVAATRRSIGLPLAMLTTALMACN
jgi:hypothetical protein